MPEEGNPLMFGMNANDGAARTLVSIPVQTFSDDVYDESRQRRPPPR